MSRNTNKRSIHPSSKVNPPPKPTTIGEYSVNSTTNHVKSLPPISQYVKQLSKDLKENNILIESNLIKEKKEQLYEVEVKIQYKWFLCSLLNYAPPDDSICNLHLDYGLPHRLVKVK